MGTCRVTVNSEDRCNCKDYRHHASNSIRQKDIKICHTTVILCSVCSMKRVHLQYMLHYHRRNEYTLNHDRLIPELAANKNSCEMTIVPIRKLVFDSLARKIDISTFFYHQVNELFELLTEFGRVSRQSSPLPAPLPQRHVSNYEHPFGCARERDTEPTWVANKPISRALFVRRNTMYNDHFPFTPLESIDCV